jgi:hypothetical protein
MDASVQRVYYALRYRKTSMARHAGIDQARRNWCAVPVREPLHYCPRICLHPQYFPHLRRSTTTLAACPEHQRRQIERLAAAGYIRLLRPLAQLFGRLLLMRPQFRQQRSIEAVLLNDAAGLT